MVHPVFIKRMQQKNSSSVFDTDGFMNSAGSQIISQGISKHKVNYVVTSQFKLNGHKMGFAPGPSSMASGVQRGFVFKVGDVIGVVTSKPTPKQQKMGATDSWSFAKDDYYFDVPVGSIPIKPQAGVLKRNADGELFFNGDSTQRATSTETTKTSSGGGQGWTIASDVAIAAQNIIGIGQSIFGRKDKNGNLINPTAGGPPPLPTVIYQATPPPKNEKSDFPWTPVIITGVALTGIVVLGFFTNWFGLKK